MKKQIIAVALLSMVLSTGFLTGCKASIENNPNEGNTNTLVDNDPTLAELPTVGEKYTNDFQEDKIPGQWDSYGIGDPFVYRYNGIYYLYASTKDGYKGVRAWKSKDLINWSKCTGAGLQEGYVSEDDSTITAYAPEVIYKNGVFYMVQSPGGKGHIILKADNPEGPFVKISDSIDSTIDGSFFYDKEEVYFFKAGGTGIRADVLNEDLTGFNGEKGSKRFDNTSLGNWTEGPYMLKRDGKYYLTYTGVHVVSPAYRVAYSYCEDENFYRNDAFTFGDNIILNTSDSYQGLGHSSTVLGPNLDSHYIAYHNLRSSGGPKRGFNLARLDFNGTQMTANHPEKEGNIVPTLATFNDYDGTNLEVKNEFKLSKIATSENRFTSEFNFKGAGTKLVFGYVDDKNYNVISIDESDGKQIINVNKIENEKATLITKYDLTKKYDLSKLHTIRISYTENQFDLHFDGMELINDFNTTLKGGKIGYIANDKTTIGYTGFSNEAEGSAQHNEFKQDLITADNHIIEKSKLSEGSGLVKVEKSKNASPDFLENGFIGANYMKLATKGDRATYLTNFDEEEILSVDIRVPKEMLGKKIGIKVNNGDIYEYQLDKYEVDTTDFKVTLGNIKVNEGANYISIYNVGDEAKFLQAEFTKTTDLKTTFENNLSDYVKQGVTYVNAWKIKNDGHYALGGTRQLAYFGDETIGDVEVEVTVNFDGQTLTKSAGLIISGKNAAFSLHDNKDSIQGYYCSINNNDIVLYDCNYNKTVRGASSYSTIEGELNSGKDIKLKVVKVGKTIKYYVNDKLHCEYVSALGNTKGYVGLYTDGAACTFKNLKIKTL